MDAVIVLTHLLAYTGGALSMFGLVMFIKMLDNESPKLDEEPEWEFVSTSTSTKQVEPFVVGDAREMTPMEKAAFQKAMVSLQDDMDEMTTDLNKAYKDLKRKR